MSKPSITIGQLLGRYRILEKIERGSQGTVYRAHDEHGLERDVALKVLETDLPGDDAARVQFRKEAEALGKLNHPNVAQGFDVGYKEEYGVDFLVTEYIPGSGLDEKVKSGPLPESTVLELGIQLTRGLAAAHRVGVIHRDLKPGNLRITEDGQLKIIDFGLAKAADPGVEAAIAETITLGKDVVGTLPYMAPEQWLGTSNQRTDVWGAGAVLYEMATGERPFPQVRLERLQEAIQHREPARPIAMNPAVSPGLERVILRCLQKDPLRRYPSAKELREDLASVASGEGRALRWLRDNGIGIAAAAVLMAITAFVTNFIDRERQHIRPPDHFVFAVIPFGAGRPDAAKNAFHRGIAETIGARIGEQNSPAALQLIPPSEAIDHGVETAEAAQREFGVNLVLEIGLEETPESLRITGSLVNPVSHQQIGARTVTGDRTKLWDLEDQLANKVFEILPTTAQSQQPTPNRVQAAEHPEGYENYERGRGYLLDYHKPENIDNAIAQFNQALSKSPNFAAAYAGLGEAYWRGFRAHRGKAWLELASTNCEKALATDPHMAGAHTCLGNLDNDTGHYDRGVDEFNRALAVDKANIQAFRGLGDAYSALGKTADAEETFKKAIAARPQYWAVYNWLGIFYSGQARYADAAPMFEKVIALTPDNHNGYYDLGGVLEYEGKYKEAIEALNHSIKLFPTMEAYSNLGAAYFYTHRYTDAIPAFEKARSLDDQDYLNWGNLGDALYWSPGRRPEATAAYKRAIELAQAQVQVNPKDASTRAYIAEYSAMVGDKSTAVDQIQQALALAPKDPDVMFRAGLVYNQLGDKQQTLQWLKKSIDGHYPPTLIRDTPDFAQLQPDPAFQALISAK